MISMSSIAYSIPAILQSSLILHTHLRQTSTSLLGQEIKCLKPKEISRSEEGVDFRQWAINNKRFEITFKPIVVISLVAQGSPVLNWFYFCSGHVYIHLLIWPEQAIFLSRRPHPFILIVWCVCLALWVMSFYFRLVYSWSTFSVRLFPYTCRQE